MTARSSLSTSAAACSVSDFARLIASSTTLLDARACRQARPAEVATRGGADREHHDREGGHRRVHAEAIPRRARTLTARRTARKARGLELLVALRLELGARLPFRELVGLRDPVADREEHLEVLARAAQVPVGPHLVGRLVVVALGELVAQLLAVAGRLADEVHALVGIERGHALLGEVEVIRAVVEALLGLGIGPDEPPLLAGRVARVVVEIRRAVADEREVLGPPVDVHPVHVDVGERLRQRIDRRDRVVPATRAAPAPRPSPT